MNKRDLLRGAVAGAAASLGATALVSQAQNVPKSAAGPILLTVGGRIGLGNRGPLLVDVIKASGAKPSERTTLLVRAVDGYAVLIAFAEAIKRRFIVATHLDDRPMTLGGLGPLWTIYDADRFPDMASKPLPERFGLCPWATYYIEVKDG